MNLLKSEQCTKYLISRKNGEGAEFLIFVILISLSYFNYNRTGFSLRKMEKFRGDDRDVTTVPPRRCHS